MKGICDVPPKNNLMIIVNIHMNIGPGRAVVFSGSMHLELDSGGRDN